MLPLPTLHGPGHACDPGGQATDSMPLLPPRRPLWPRPSAKVLAKPMGHVCGHENQDVQPFRTVQPPSLRGNAGSKSERHLQELPPSAHCEGFLQCPLAEMLCVKAAQYWRYLKILVHVPRPLMGKILRPCSIWIVQCPNREHLPIHFSVTLKWSSKGISNTYGPMVMNLVVQVLPLHDCSALPKSASGQRTGTKIWFQPSFWIAWTSRFLQLHLNGPQK